MEQTKILIIEDEERIGKMLVRRLKKVGYLTEVAHDGDVGLERAFDTNPDLILLDIHMPKLDGYEVVKALRKNNYKGLVVACSASVGARDTQKTIDAGCDFFISKPIGPDFEQQIETILTDRNV